MNSTNPATAGSGISRSITIRLAVSVAVAVSMYLELSIRLHSLVLRPLKKRVSYLLLGFLYPRKSILVGIAYHAKDSGVRRYSCRFPEFDSITFSDLSLILIFATQPLLTYDRSGEDYSGPHRLHGRTRCDEFPKGNGYLRRAD